jgi:predicted nucleic acid-binding protein
MEPDIKYLYDTCILIDFLRGNSKLDAVFSDEGQAHLAISTIYSLKKIMNKGFDTYL